MPLNRRNVLKTLLMSPFFGAAKALSAQPDTVPGNVNILLHGLFFMEQDDNNNLVIRAPKLNDHVFLAGTTRNLQAGTDMNWSKGYGLKGGTPSVSKGKGIPPEVKASILQFTREETGVGNFKTDPNLYFGTITLPWPQNFYPLRQGGPLQFDLNRKNVGPAIANRCKGQIGTTICLQYGYDFSGPVLPGSTPTMNFQLHLASCKDNDHVNDALDAASAIFNQPNFDLHILNSSTYTDVDQDPGILGVSPEDEESADEDEPNFSHWCPNAQRHPAHRSQPHHLKGHKHKKNCPPNQVCAENVSPANCPTFFVG
jgi:hypothetical protein